MASSDSVGKLRRTLDDMSTARLEYPTADLYYYEAVLRRLDYNFTTRTMASGDDAVRVITPEEWTLANQARLAAEQRQREIEAMQGQLNAVEAREDDLKSEIERLQSQLDDAHSRRDDMVQFEFVGVRPVGGGASEPVEAAPQPPPPEKLLEFEMAEEEPEPELEWSPEPTREWSPEPAQDWPTAPPKEQAAKPPASMAPEPVAWEETGETEWKPPEPERPAMEPSATEPAPAQTWEAAPEAASVEEAPAWEEPAEESPWEEAPPARVTAPPPSHEAVEVEGEIRKIEDEIRKIEEELALIAAQERELGARGGMAEEQEPSQTAAYTTRGYTLFTKDVKNPDGSTRPFYFFSKETEREDATASTMPEGYKVGVNARTGMPYLKKKTSSKGKK